jgi:hypothetical protein
MEVKGAVADKAVEVKDAIADKTAEATDAAAEKLGEAKLAVSEALDDAGSLASRWGRGGWHFTTANAVPLALVGLGASWMIMNNRRAPQPRAARYQPESAEPELYLGAPNDDEEPQASREASALIQRGKRQAGKGARVARERLSRARDASLDFVDANPLVMALGTLALGVGVGLLLPTTEREERLLAPTRAKFARLMGDAREVATDVVEMAKETANETMARS